jgi:5-methyltetrahydropteroyltriglutamate--homocysteine methyltransferase
MLRTTIAGSLPKPLWLAEPEKLWAPWKLEGEALEQGKRDATVLAVKLQEDAGLDIVGDGEQARVHFVHGFLANLDGIDFAKKTMMGIRNNRYMAEVPTVVGPIRRKGSVHGMEARAARAHTRHQLKFTLPGPMTIVDTIADEHYGRRADLAMAFAEVLNEEAKELEAIGVDVVQFDEPAYNVFMAHVPTWGVASLHRAIDGLTCTTAVHICYGYGIQANVDWKATLGEEWRQYEAVFPALAASRIDQISLECANSRVPDHLLGLLAGKDVLVGVIDVASEVVETPEQVADTIGRALRYVPANRLFPCTNCGMAPMSREVAAAKLRAQLDEETARRLLLLPGTLVRDHTEPVPATLDEITRREQARISREISERNAQFFEVEANKLDNWADDLKVGLEREIKDIDRQIKEARRAASAALTLEEKLQGQKQIKALEAHRKERRRSLFDAQDEIDANRERLIEKIEGKLKSDSSEEMLFTIRWILE